MPLRGARLRAIAPTLALGLGVVYLVITRLLLAWNGIISGDGARDLAVAARLLRGEEFPLQGPLFGNIVHLGPLYYYVVALPLGLFQTATGVISFLVLLSLTSVYFAYRVGSLLFDRRIGLLFACLLGGDFVAALSAFQLSNIHLILPISLALLQTTLLAVLHRRAKYLGLALVLAAVALQIHPTTGALLPLLALALCLPIENGKIKALALGAAAALLLSAPYIAYEFIHRGDNLREVLDTLYQRLRIGWGAPLSALPEIFWWALFVGPKTAIRLSDGIAPSSLRLLALAALYVVPLAALAGLGLALAGLFRKEQQRSCALLLCWLLPWWVIAPRVLVPISWWHLYAIQPALLLCAALALVRLCDRLPGFRRWPTIAPYLFGALGLVLPAWLGLAAFQRAAGEGLLRLPDSLFWRTSAQAQAADFLYPTIGVRQEERLITALLKESGCDASLLTRLHGLPLSLTLQSRGIFLQIHQRRCRADREPAHAVSFVGLRTSDLPPAFTHSAEIRGPLSILRQAIPGYLTDARYSEAHHRGWETRAFGDRAWRPLTLPAFRPPDPAVYPPLPDMDWNRSPIFIRAGLRYAGTGPVLLGVAFPSSATWVYQGRVEAMYVNGTPAPPPRHLTPYLLLYDLEPVLRPGENLLALSVAGNPNFALDMFALLAED